MPRLTCLLTLFFFLFPLTNPAPVNIVTDLETRTSTGGHVYDWPLDWTPFGFTGNLTVGTFPPQKIRSFVDITWIGQYLLTSKCKGRSNNTANCFLPSQQYFNELASPSFHYAPEYPSLKWNPNHFFFYDDLRVDIAKEYIGVGPANTDVCVEASDITFTQSFSYPFAGVFGLSPVFCNDSVSIQSPFYQQWKSGVWRKPYTSFHYCYPGVPKHTCRGHDAIQRLGGYDTRRVKANTLKWYPVIQFPLVNEIDFEYNPPIYNYWTLNLTGVSIGTEPQAINATHGAGAVFDHASYGRGAPLSENAYDSLIQITEAKPVALSDPWAVNNGNQTFHHIPCESRNRVPPIKYYFEGDSKPWVIEGRSYVVEVEGKCVLNVRTLGAKGTDMVIGNFGETFARDKYIVLDFEGLKVGLGDAKF